MKPLLIFTLLLILAIGVMAAQAAPAGSPAYPAPQVYMPYVEGLPYWLPPIPTPAPVSAYPGPVEYPTPWWTPLATKTPIPTATPVICPSVPPFDPNCG